MSTSSVVAEWMRGNPAAGYRCGTQPGGPDVKKNLACPCGEMIRGENEDDLVAKTQAHLREKHPDKVDDYTRDMILFMAY